MPSQEERLGIVEYDLKHFKTETIKAYSDMAMELVMVKGLTEDAVKRLATLKEQIDRRFDTVEQRLDRLETKFDEHTALLTQILERLPKTT